MCPGNISSSCSMFKNITVNNKHVKYNKNIENKELAKGKISYVTQNIILHVCLYTMYSRIKLKFVSDLRQVGGFLHFPLTIKLPATI
jgi:hypothetical protein